MIEKLIVQAGFSSPIGTASVGGILMGQVFGSGLGPESLSPSIEDKMAFLKVN